MQTLITVGIISGISIVALVAMGLIFSRLYKKSSKELGFVRTGLWGEKVVLDGGALVLPVLHEVIPVNLKTMRLEVSRTGKNALITKDKYRADVTSEFFIRVDSKQAAVAAQTLGTKTMNPEELKKLIEGKMVDALRAVASQMNMNEMHEQRADFVQNVQNTLKTDLDKNGLELESVSLTGLDQTSKEYFDENNVFDAEGLTKLTEEIESKRKRRNDIEKNTDVEINQKNLETNKLNLTINSQNRQAELDQEKEIATREEEQATEVANMKAQKKREQEQARITSEREIQEAEIQSAKELEEKRIAKDKEIQSKQIEKEQAIETEKIAKEEAIRTAEIKKQKAIEEANILKQQSVEIAEQNKSISLAEKSKEQSIVQAEANAEKEKAVRTDQAVITAQETAIASREKEVSIIKAQQEAEKLTTADRIKSEAEVQIAENKAKAIRTEAEAKADAEIINAKAKAESEKLAAEANEITNKVEAEGKRLIIEADNSVSAEVMEFRLKMETVQIAPRIVAESVKPLEKIDGIKLVQVDGLQPKINGYNGNGNGNGSDDVPPTGKTVSGVNLTDQVVNSALAFRAAAPMVDELLKTIGFDGKSVEGLTKTIKGVISTDEPKNPKIGTMNLNR